MAVIGEMHYLTIGNNTYSIPVSGGGGGTVTSVRVQATSPVQSSTSSEQSVSLNTTISLADGYGDTKNPYGTKTANYVLAGPTSGAAATPSFRKLVAADIPDLSSSYLVASTVIPTKVSDLTNDSGFVTTDEKLKTIASQDNTSYYLTMGSNSGTPETKYHDYGLRYELDTNKSTGILTVGYSPVSGHQVGKIRLIGSTTCVTTIEASATSSHKTLTLPDATGTVALISDVPTITLNGSSTTSPSFYAPTSSGSSGQVLKSNGSGAPTWTTAVLTDEKVKMTPLDGVNSNRGVLFSSNAGSPEITATASTSNKLTWNDSTGDLFIYNTNGVKYGLLNYDKITLANADTNVKGTIQTAAVTTNRTYTLPNASGTVALTSDIPNNIVNTITTAAGAHTAITNQTGNVSFNIPTTAAHVDAASSSHTHGNITNGGDITATAPTIASGDQIVINDHSASKITNGPTFDGSTTTTALTPKGTWETFSKFSGSYNDLTNKPTIPTDTNTTYTLSGALSSHKITSTLTAGGSGSGTSTSDFTLAAGTGISITDNTNTRTMTIASTVVNTKTTISSTAPASGNVAGDVWFKIVS